MSAEDRAAWADAMPNIAAEWAAELDASGEPGPRCCAPISASWPPPASPACATGPPDWRTEPQGDRDAAQPFELRRVLNGLTRATNGVAIAANVTGTLVVLGLVVVVNYRRRRARRVQRARSTAPIEVVQFSMVLIVFLQLPDVVRVNRLTRSDGFLLLIGKQASPRRLRDAPGDRRAVRGAS